MNRMLGIAVATSAALLGATLALAPSSQAAGTAEVSVVHGIPKTPVAVFVDGKSALQNFKPGTVAGPLDLPAGAHTVTVFPASDTKGTGTPVIKATATLTAGTNYSLVAHLTTAGKPTLTPYVNDVSTVDAGQARLVVRHDAAAPAVDVRTNGKVTFAKLTNPKQAAADLPAGSIRADVTLAGTSTVAIGPATLNLAEGTSTIVYAIGSATDKTLALVTQTIDGLHSAPGGVNAGSGGLLDHSPGVPAGVWFAGSSALLVLLVGGFGPGPDGAALILRRQGRRRTALAIWATVAVVGAGGSATVAVVAARDDRGLGSSTTAPIAAGEATRLSGGDPSSSAPPATSLPTPTSAPAPSMPPPVRVTIAAIGVRAPVVPIGVDGSGDVAVPERIDTVGWYRFGALPGSARGSAVLVGHVDSAVQGEGAFFDLRRVGRWDTVRVRTANGRTLTYRVVSRQQFPKSSVPLAALFSLTGSPRLTLVTCGGSFDATRRSYRDNVVVTAVPTQVG